MRRISVFLQAYQLSDAHIQILADSEFPVRSTYCKAIDRGQINACSDPGHQ